MAEPREINTSDGGGGAVTVELAGTRDINLMRRAIVERWPVSPQRMQAYMAALDRVIEHSQDDRALVAAVSTLIAADRANVAAFLATLKAEQGPTEHKHLHVHGELAKMSDDELAEHIDRLKRGLARPGTGEGGAGEAQACPPQEGR